MFEMYFFLAFFFYVFQLVGTYSYLEERNMRMPISLYFTNLIIASLFPIALIYKAYVYFAQKSTQY